MKLGELLSGKGRHVFTAHPEDTVLDAVRKLVSHNIGALAVVDSHGKLVGIFTERDVLRLCALSPINFATILLHDHMTKNLVTGNSQATMEEALAVMSEQRIRHLPVVDDEKLTGMVSQGDLVKASLEDMKFEHKQLTNFVLGKYPG
jgi:CBS domain-containing protein